jgi:hypothetical protein
MSSSDPRQHDQARHAVDVLIDEPQFPIWDRRPLAAESRGLAQRTAAKDGTRARMRSKRLGELAHDVDNASDANRTSQNPGLQPLPY